MFYLFFANTYLEIHDVTWDKMKENIRLLLLVNFNTVYYGSELCKCHCPLLLANFYYTFSRKKKNRIIVDIKCNEHVSTTHYLPKEYFKSGLLCRLNSF